MEKIYTSAEELIGNTPTVRLCRIERELELSAELYAKLEMKNPGGSVKDRAALSVIEEAERDGRLCRGGVIIEPTSGNFGIALALVGLGRGYRVIAVMPSSASRERIELLSALGAEIVLTDGKDGMRGAIKRATELKDSISGSFMPDQFSNFAPVKFHFNTTAEEIIRDMDGAPDIFVCGVGSGATLSGVGARLKKKNEKTRIVAVEPSSSAVISGGRAGIHRIQGLGAGFLPRVLDLSLIDRVIGVSDGEALDGARLAAGREGILCGISSGAAIHAMIGLAKEDENRGKRLLAILPDGAERYLSSGIYSRDNKQT